MAMVVVRDKDAMAAQAASSQFGTVGVGVVISLSAAEQGSHSSTAGKQNTRKTLRGGKKELLGDMWDSHVELT